MRTTINRVKRLTDNLLSTGDDDGVVKLWDPRKSDAVRSYAHHFDFISDFLWLEDKKHLVCTSGDGTLSVLDVRSKKTEPFAKSEDQEDELLSVVAIKEGQKLVIGTQLGILSIFNRRSGYSDCVDRVPGHPHSIDALSPIPSRYPNAASTILTGSSDGLVRVVELLPSKLVGVVADHGDFPVERVKVDRSGEGDWVGSVGHEEVLKLTDLREVFEDEDSDEGEGESASDKGEEGSGNEDGDECEGADSENEGSHGSGSKRGGQWLESTSGENEDKESSIDGSSNEDDISTGSHKHSNTEAPAYEMPEREAVVDEEEDSDRDSDTVKERKRKRKKDKDPFKASKKPKGRNELVADPSFFVDL